LRFAKKKRLLFVDIPQTELFTAGVAGATAPHHHPIRKTEEERLGILDTATAAKCNVKSASCVSF
jgi:hypothetical protein